MGSRLSVTSNMVVLETYEVNRTYLQALFLQQKKNISCKKATNTNVKLDVKLTMWWQLGYKWPNSNHLEGASFVHSLNPNIILNLRLEKWDMIILESLEMTASSGQLFKSAHNLNAPIHNGPAIQLGALPALRKRFFAWLPTSNNWREEFLKHVLVSKCPPLSQDFPISRH